MAKRDKPLEPKWVYYLISFSVPPVGVIIGINYLVKEDPESKSFGRNCVLAQTAALIVWCLVYSIYIVSCTGV